MSKKTSTMPSSKPKFHRIFAGLFDSVPIRVNRLANSCTITGGCVL